MDTASFDTCSEIFCCAHKQSLNDSIIKSMEDSFKKLEVKLAKFQISTSKDYEFQFCWKIKDAFKDRLRKRFTKKFKIDQANEQFRLSYVFPTKQHNLSESAFNEMFKTEMYIILSHGSLPNKKIAGKLSFPTRYFVMSAHSHYRQKFFLSNCPDKGAYVEFDIYTSVPKLGNNNSMNVSLLKRSFSNQSFSNSVNNETAFNISNLSYISVESLSDELQPQEERSKSQPLLFAEDIAGSKKRPLSSFKVNKVDQSTRSRNDASPTRDLTDGDFEFSLDENPKTFGNRAKGKAPVAPQKRPEKPPISKYEPKMNNLDLIHSPSKNQSNHDMKASNFTFCQPEVTESPKNQSEVFVHELARFQNEAAPPSEPIINSLEDLQEFQSTPIKPDKNSNFFKLQQRLAKNRSISQLDSKSISITESLPADKIIDQAHSQSLQVKDGDSLPIKSEPKNIREPVMVESQTSNEYQFEIKQLKKEVKRLRTQLELAELNQQPHKPTENTSSDIFNEIQALKATVDAHKIEVV